MTNAAALTREQIRDLVKDKSLRGVFNLRIHSQYSLLAIEEKILQIAETDKIKFTHKDDMLVKFPNGMTFIINLDINSFKLFKYFDMDIYNTIYIGDPNFETKVREIIVRCSRDAYLIAHCTNLQNRVNTLEGENTELKRQLAVANDMLKYAPGAPGALSTGEHFRGLCAQPK
jgi:hypothetical protein